MYNKYNYINFYCIYKKVIINYDIFCGVYLIEFGTRRIKERASI